MSNLYVACQLAADKGRMFLGALQKEGLTVSEAGHLEGLIRNQPDSVEWDVSNIYQQVLRILRSIMAQEEPVRGLTFYSGTDDSLLFEGNGTLISPAQRPGQAAVSAQLNKLLAKLPKEALYDETGVQATAGGMLCYLTSETSKRLKKAKHALPLPDGLNYLFSGVPRVEASQASQTQLYNPLSKSWSARVLEASGLPERLLPPVVSAGTQLGPVRPEIAKEAGLEDARVTTTCSHEMAAALAALTIADPNNWTFLWPEASTRLGTCLAEPFVNDISREMRYSNMPGYGSCVGFSKTWVGLRMIEECHRAWAQQDRALDNEVLMHLATSATPFEALIDPADPRFLTATDMPQAIQAFCRETGQEVPRKPGPILRCVLESLALQYRKGLLELEYITGNTLSRLYVLGGKSNLLLNHFLANALQLPVVVVPDDAAAIGNIAVQALALGHIPSVEQASELVQRALRLHTINPHATAWTEAFDRFLGLTPA